jgi:hypothetical protein
LPRRSTVGHDVNAELIAPLLEADISGRQDHADRTASKQSVGAENAYCRGLDARQASVQKSRPPAGARFAPQGTMCHLWL